MNWIADPGHSWLKVKIVDIIRAGVWYKISGYSHIHGEYAYLEKDRDAAIFLDAIGCTKTLITVYSHKQSQVRFYKSWPVGSVKQLLEVL